MKAGLGLVSLLLALVLVGLLATRGLKALSHPGLASAPPSPALPQTPVNGTPEQRAVQLENRARDEVTRAVNDAEARRQEAAKP